MAKSTKAKRARNAVGSAADNPYLKRIMEDEDLRESVRDAFESARDAYERLSSNGSVIDTAIDDKKVHKDLKATAENLREASDPSPGPEEGAPLGPAARDRARGRGARAGAQRGPAQGGARPALRRRGGVRVHLDHHPGPRTGCRRRLGARPYRTALPCADRGSMIRVRPGVACDNGQPS